LVDLSAERVTCFAALSGDVHPLHADDEFAKAAGFPSRVAFRLHTTSVHFRFVGVDLTDSGRSYTAST
jgi:acyl dehydratase